MQNIKLFSGKYTILNYNIFIFNLKDKQFGFQYFLIYL